MRRRVAWGVNNGRVHREDTVRRNTMYPLSPRPA